MARLSRVGNSQSLVKEITQYSATLAEKPRIVVLSKADVLPPEERADRANLAGLPQARLISAHSGEGLRDLLEDLWRMILAASETGETDDVG